MARSTGKFDTFPATVARDGALVAAAAPATAAKVEVRRDAPHAAATGFDWGYLARTASDAVRHPDLDRPASSGLHVVQPGLYSLGSCLVTLSISTTSAGWFKFVSNECIQKVHL